MNFIISPFFSDNMINDFLKVVAENLRSRFNNDLSKVIVVFPNKRANLFFNEYLIASDEDVIWAPRYFSISDFFGITGPGRTA